MRTNTRWASRNEKDFVHTGSRRSRNVPSSNVVSGLSAKSFERSASLVERETKSPRPYAQMSKLTTVAIVTIATNAVKPFEKITNFGIQLPTNWTLRNAVRDCSSMYSNLMRTIRLGDIVHDT